MIREGIPSLAVSRSLNVTSDLQSILSRPLSLAAWQIGLP
jgi:hypothetical protein